MQKKDKIKLKIKALLEKTPERGATQAEALSALNKAHQLMKQYFVSEHDLHDPFLGEKCVLKSVDLIKVGYNTNFFYTSLSKLFDCKGYTTKDKLFFFGFEEDVELCIYFYTVIINSCNLEKEKYRLSSSYKILKGKYHSRTIMASFIKGFLIEVNTKIDDMYKERKSGLNNAKENGLVVVQKENKVASEFDKLNLNLKTRNQKVNIKKEAFMSGSEKGKNFNIVQGVNNSRSNNTLQIKA